MSRKTTQNPTHHPSSKSDPAGIIDAHKSLMTITGSLTVAAAVLAVGLIMELCAVFTAPVGYQDETGFHPGVKRNEDTNDGA